MGAVQNYGSASRRQPDIEDYIDMVRRYRSWIIGPMFAGLVVAVVVAFFWPDTYVSTAVMTITPQQVSQSLVHSDVTTQMGMRLQEMETEILSRSSLSDLIVHLDLYKKERTQKPLEDIVQDMRNKAIQVRSYEPAASGAENRVQAFTISFSYTDRYKAQQVVRELIGKFEEENLRYRSEVLRAGGVGSREPRAGLYHLLQLHGPLQSPAGGARADRQVRRRELEIQIGSLASRRRREPRTACRPLPSPSVTRTVTKPSRWCAS